MAIPGPAAHAAQQNAADVKGAALELDGTIHVPAITIPLSSYMSEESKQFFISSQTQHEFADAADFQQKSLDQQRRIVDGWFRPQVERTKSLYPVSITEKKIAGVRTDVVVPKTGISARNRHRVLISLHGGSYN
jgi:acetyl esterase/lipase